MTQKFNPKVYSGKTRVFTAIPQAPRISRMWYWDENAKEYKAPSNGIIYYAARYEADSNGNKKRHYGSFATLEECRDWQKATAEGPIKVAAPEAIEPEQQPRLLFRELMAEWKRRRFPLIAYSTQVQYDKVLRLHFGSLLDLTVHEITPKRIDAWLDELKEGTKASTKRMTRISFGHELSLLSTILKYYHDYHDDSEYQFPVKQRHRDAIRLGRPKSNAPKDLSEPDFLKFREELRKCKNGEMLAGLATVQYYQALRISEAAGLYWEDIDIDWAVPQNSRIKVVRSVCFPHRGKEEPFIKVGFKNSEGNKGMKEQPMFPETFEVISEFFRPTATGLLFSLDGKPLSYRTIQCHYDRSFRRAELPYRGTHVMRHGGCRRVFNEVAELSIAQQLLGNSDMKTTLVYAKRHAGALTKVVHGYWERKPKLLTTADNQQKIEPENKSLLTTADKHSPENDN